MKHVERKCGQICHDIWIRVKFIKSHIRSERAVLYYRFSREVRMVFVIGCTLHVYDTKMSHGANIRYIHRPRSER